MKRTAKRQPIAHSKAHFTVFIGIESFLMKPTPLKQSPLHKHKLVSPYKLIEGKHTHLINRHVLSFVDVFSRTLWFRMCGRWCLTGTPLQNKLDDLFALMHFLRLTPFSDRQWWQTFVARSMTADSGVRRLAKFLPFVTLRRTKKQVIDGKPTVELPPRVDTIIEVELSEMERKVYDMVLARGRSIFNALDESGNVVR